MYDYEMIYDLHPIPSTELLGYAKNNITEVLEMEDMLPQQYQTVLSLVYHVLDGIQEYLYNN